MDQLRLIRFSYPGILFLFSLFAMNWILGGNLLIKSYEDITRLSKGNSLQIISTIISALIVSTPVFGFILTSFSYEWILRRVIRLVTIPKELENDYEIGISRLANLERSDFKKFSRSIRLSLHQVVLRTSIEKESLNFTERRWGYGLLHLNSFFSIGIGLLVALILFLCSGDFYSHIPKASIEIRMLKVFVCLILLFYCVFGFFFARKNIREANNFEINWIIIRANHPPVITSEK